MTKTLKGEQTLRKIQANKEEEMFDSSFPRKLSRKGRETLRDRREKKDLPGKVTCVGRNRYHSRRETNRSTEKRVWDEKFTLPRLFKQGKILIRKDSRKIKKIFKIHD